MGDDDRGDMSGDSCPACGSDDPDGLRELDDGRVRCSACIDSVLIEERRVRRTIDKIGREASTHGSNYAAGMRQARAIAEQDLLGIMRDASASTYRAE